MAIFYAIGDVADAVVTNRECGRISVQLDPGSEPDRHTMRVTKTSLIISLELRTNVKVER